MSYWYISFADDDNGGFLGGVCVEAPNCMAATAKVTSLGIDPGGEALAFDVTEFGVPPYPLPVTPEGRKRKQDYDARSPSEPAVINYRASSRV